MFGLAAKAAKAGVVLFVKPKLAGLRTSGMKIALISTRSMLIWRAKANRGNSTASKTFAVTTNCVAAKTVAPPRAFTRGVSAKSAMVTTTKFLAPAK